MACYEKTVYKVLYTTVPCYSSNCRMDFIEAGLNMCDGKCLHRLKQKKTVTAPARHWNVL